MPRGGTSPERCGLGQPRGHHAFARIKREQYLGLLPGVGLGGLCGSSVASRFARRSLIYSSPRTVKSLGALSSYWRPSFVRRPEQLTRAIRPCASTAC